MDNPQETFECTRCNKFFFSDGFKVDRLGRRLKTCLECNARSKAERERYTCPHGRQNKSCRDCGGSSFCLHEHLRAQCRICSPKSSKASAELAHFRYYQKLSSWPIPEITVEPTRWRYDIVAPRLGTIFTKLREEGRLRPDEYDALMAKRKEWEGPPQQAPQLTDSEVAEILAPIYAEMEPQKPPRGQTTQLGELRTLLLLIWVSKVPGGLLVSKLLRQLDCALWPRIRGQCRHFRSRFRDPFFGSRSGQGGSNLVGRYIQRFFSLFGYDGL